MTRLRLLLLLLLLPGFLGVVLGVAFGRAPVYSDGPPAAHTGGFGEPTCHQCHFDQPRNAPGGSLTIDGLPADYVAGARYLLLVRLARPAMQRGGFQVSARFAEGSREGRQAGAFQPVDDHVEVSRDDSSFVQYAQHTEAGTGLAAADTAHWSVVWTAPDTADARIVFHATANAANADDSELGDFIYASEWASDGAGRRE